ncbi:hypothetical protein HDF16_000326 [Granulicella aggregans]|uniref:Uncharacterized protein n=1 Tax=Granulicella aggregans TaxID=474949 RepID=A0A7W7Z9C0_9BACT|nr:hypothetical protein [Granulicella aggregans]MBB5055657.1 hypothetical protein [Granulicella aggregans]
MKRFSPIAAGVVLLALIASGERGYAAVGSETSPAGKKFEQAVERTGNLHLPLNRAYLYRQAAGAVAQRDKAEAVGLLKRALSDIDAAEVAARAAATVDDAVLRQLEMGRRSTILQVLRIDSGETLRLLAAPQTADGDMELQRQVFDRVASDRASAKGIDLVRDAAARKLEFGVTPAVVAGYDMLRRRDAGAAKLFGAAIVFRLKTIDPASDPLAVTSAFALLKLQKGDGGRRESKVNLSASALEADSLTTLYTFIGDAFLEEQDPTVLALTEKPTEYMQAMQQYAPEKADELTQALAAASTAAATAATSAAKTAVDAEQPTAEEKAQLEAARAQVQARLAAQIRETYAHTRQLSQKIGQTSLSGEERDNAVFAAVEEANRSLSLGRALAKDLEPEAFNNGELEFYGFGQLNGVVDSVSSILQRYALDHPGVAEDAASRLDGTEVQTEVELQIAIREMNGRVGFSGDRDGRRHRMQDDVERPTL